MPLMMTVLMLIFAVERRGFAMGMAGLVISFAPALGPAIAGWLVDVFPWRFLFLFILPLAIIDLILAYYFMKNIITRTRSEEHTSELQSRGHLVCRLLL